MDAVAVSAWGDAAAGGSPADLPLGLRSCWAQRVAAAASAAADWVAGADALLLARELLLAGGQARREQLRGLPGVGEDTLRASSLDELRAALPVQAAWALTGINEPSGLWRAELLWWERVARDAPALMQTWGDEAVVLAAVALLAVDAQRTMRALAVAARGGSPELVELIGGSG